MNRKYFILKGTQPVEADMEKYYKWARKPSSKKINKRHTFKNCKDVVELEFSGGDGFRREDGKLFRVSFRFDSGYIHDEWDRIIDEDYATYRWALQRFNEYKKNGRKTPVVFKKEFDMGRNKK